MTEPSTAAATNEKPDWWFLLGPRYASRLISKRLLDLRVSKAGCGVAPWPPQPGLSVSAAKSTIDLRPAWGPVLDQGELTSCMSNALAGLVRYLAAKSGIEIEPSRLYLHSKARLLAAPGFGLATLRDVAHGFGWAAGQGVCPEVLWPTLAARLNDVPPANCDLAAADCKLSGGYDLMANTKTSSDVLSNVLAALSMRLPVLVAFRAYSSFLSEPVAKSGSVPVPNLLTETLEGGHEAVIVGYIPATDQYILANSYGASWGKDGFAFLPAAFVGNSKICFELTVFTHVICPALASVSTLAPIATTTTDPAALMAKALESAKMAQLTANAAVHTATQALESANIATKAANAASIAANAAAAAASSAIAMSKKAAISAAATLSAVNSAAASAASAPTRNK